ncbi:hypothetical protein V6582_01385 (plasmid) [Agrobacterium vitis]|uniref:hypothetical protein n=1 Tax=Agrobacterium vitis TaxID=373 RepID=UPI0012E81745|nr:hypothetical protein [Agrobacterium vitis]MVA25078.1 hypothetical protein [Agrobacterium vitis]
MTKIPHDGEIPLIAFIHIMKAAGSSVNRFLEYCSPRGHWWLHNYLSSPDTIRQLSLESDWISGHFRRDEIEPIIHNIGRRVEFYSAVRNPTRRLLSHLNYSIERFKRPDYYKLHNKKERILDFSIMGRGLSNKYNLFEIILKNEEDLCNIQAKFILGSNFDKMSIDDIREKVSSYKFICTEKNIKELYDSFDFILDEYNENDIFENKSEQYIDFNLEEDDEFIEFCKENSSYDYVVYEMVENVFGCREILEKYRPSFTRRIKANAENFDENAYLLANPDVSQAVSENLIRTGLDHFLSYGKDEGRMQFTWTQRE